MPIHATSLMITLRKPAGVGELVGIPVFVGVPVNVAVPVFVTVGVKVLVGVGVTDKAQFAFFGVPWIRFPAASSPFWVTEPLLEPQIKSFSMPVL